jgi:acetyl esterase/lipase
MHFQIENQTALISAPLQVTINDLAVGSNVTLRAQTTDRHGELWHSSAVFTVPVDGRLELDRDAAQAGGSYEGRDANGLVWSMQPRGDLENIFFYPPDGGFTVNLRLEQDGITLETAGLHRQMRSTNLRRLEVRENGLIGTLFAPAEAEFEGAFIGVLELGGSEGKLNEARAALLASHGFAVLALAYFDLSGLPDQLINVPLEYFKSALDWLRDRPEVSSQRIGVIGTSKGGEAALLIAATYPETVGGVVGVVPSGVVFEGIDRTGTLTGGPNSSWSIAGNPVPCVPYNVNWDAYFSQPPPVSLTPAHRISVDSCDPATLEAATIRVERIMTPVLLISGGDDATWQSHDLSLIAQARLEAHGRQVKHISDKSAGHNLSLPGLPSFMRSPWMVMGGTPEANARIQRAGWESTLEVLRDGSH